MTLNERIANICGAFGLFHEQMDVQKSFNFLKVAHIYYGLKHNSLTLDDSDFESFMKELSIEDKLYLVSEMINITEENKKLIPEQIKKLMVMV